MTATALTFNSIEGISYRILKEATDSVKINAKQSSLAIKHFRLFQSTKAMVADMFDLLETLHQPSVVIAIESADPEVTQDIGETILRVCHKTTAIVATMRSTNFGYWEKLYRQPLEKLETYSTSLESHARAFTRNDLAVVLLSREDENALLESLLNPPQPNEALRRSFAKRD